MKIARYFGIRTVVGVLSITFILLLPLGCDSPAPVLAPRISGIRLVLFVVVDQARADYLQRFAPFLKGGLAELINSGASFENAEHLHAVTETCPGHATLISGTNPARSGIVGNSWFDRSLGQEVYCASDGRYGTGPEQLLVDSLPDWIKSRWASSRIFSVSGKDRSAVMLGGHVADGAYWYSKMKGGFASSGYYPLGDARWLSEFNQANPISAKFGEYWNARDLSPEDLKPVGIISPNNGDFQSGFPHVFGGASPVPGRDFYESITLSPWVDELTLKLAERIVTEENIGVDAIPDFLGISLSSLDWVGHAYGPQSREVLETFISVDEKLGEFLHKLWQKIPREQVLIVLSSDHGTAPLPEVSKRSGNPSAQRINQQGVHCIQSVSGEVKKILNLQRLFMAPWYLDPSVLSNARLGESIVDDTVRQATLACPLVQQVVSSRELRLSDAQDRSIQARYFRSYNKTRSPDYYVVPREYSLFLSGRETTHDSPYTYDSHVPLIFSGPGITQANITAPVGTIDVAPTLAELIGLAPKSELDGRSLVSVLVGKSEEK